MPVLERKVDARDPYRNYRLRVVLDGRFVAGLSKMSALKRARMGNQMPPPPGRLLKVPNPGRTKFEAVTLERGVTNDPGFDAWARRVHDAGAPAASLKSARKDLRVQMLDLTGQVARTVTLTQCWVSEYQALPDLDAGSNTVLIEAMKVEHEGWVDDGE
jgi:phage tail-like protein